ncbi:hypothetical protein D3C72_1169350 [compost metagenome]
MQLRRFDGALGQPGHQPQLFQFTDGVRQQVDADAQGPEFLRAFIHAAIDAAPMQHQRKRQAADAGPGNDDLHVYSWFYLLCNITKIRYSSHPGDFP